MKVASVSETMKYRLTVIPDVELVVNDGKASTLLGRDTVL